MPDITGAYEPPFDPRDRPPTWLVPLAALNRRPTVLLAICKACQHKRRWPVAELVERYGGRRMVQDLWVRWRMRVRRSSAVRDRGRGRELIFGRRLTVAIWPVDRLPESPLHCLALALPEGPLPTAKVTPPRRP